MSALVRKEIRLLLSAWIAAMLLVIAPIPLGPLFEHQGFNVSFTDPYGVVTTKLTLFGLGVGCILLGLAGFGREMSSRTFSLLLSQPRPRGEYWRAKIGVLLGSLIPLALFLGLVSWQFILPSKRWENALVWFVTACVAVTSGLWTTLLFRQIIASFWISVLVPFAILVSVMSLGDEMASEDTRTTIAITLLLAYSVAGYLFAHWQFLHAQDTAWTGGNVSLPGLDRWLPWKRAASAPQKLHPLRTLLGKELQFQQINFLLAGLLLLVQLAALLLQKLVNTSEYSLLDMLVQNFWGIWIIMPLLVGGSAVAEERKLGMLDSQLCLPVSRAWQFTVKVFVTLACGIVLGALVPVALSVLRLKGAPVGGDFILGWTLLCAGLALVSLYASSLTNQVLQAIPAAIGISFVGFVLGNWFAGTFSGGERQFTLLGFGLWQGPLVLVVGALVMFVAAMILSWRRWRWVWISLLILIAGLLGLGVIQSLRGAISAMESKVLGVRVIVVVASTLALCPVLLALTLAAKNFNHPQTSLSLWRRNAAIWLGCFVLTGVINTLVYNRAWEVLMRFEPPAGPPRLSGNVQPVITSTFVNRPTLVLLPDGRLCSYKGYERIPAPDTGDPGDKTFVTEYWRTVSKPRVEFVGGSNWLTIAVTGREVVGVKSDGSLWRAAFHEQVDQAGNVAPLYTATPMQKGSQVRATRMRFDRFGIETNWVSVAAGWQHWVALRRDGTIWGWGENKNKQLGDGAAVFTNEPVQIGQASDWVAVFASAIHSFAVKQSGEVWKWGKFTTDMSGSSIEEGPVKLNFEGPEVRGIASEGSFDLILDADGLLWGLGRVPASLIGTANANRIHTTPIRIPGERWSTVRVTWQGFAGLKQDGALWNQPVTRLHDDYFRPPVRFGERTDWVAVSRDWDSVLALAKDGTICRFGTPNLVPELELLAPTRSVTWSLNLLDASE